MQTKHISIGVVIAVILIIYWWMHDHPSTQPVKQGSLTTLSINV